MRLKGFYQVLQSAALHLPHPKDDPHYYRSCGFPSHKVYQSKGKAVEDVWSSLTASRSSRKAKTPRRKGTGL